MSEQPDVLTEPRPAEPEAAQDKPRRWPLISGGVITLAIVATGLVQFLGAPVALVVAGCTAGAAVLGVVAWKLPQLRKHFGLGRGRSGKRWSFGMKRLAGGKRSGAGLKMPKLGGRGGKALGRGKGLPKLGGRSGGKGLTGRAKGLGRALAGKGKALAGRGRGLGKSLTGKGKSLGKGLAGKGKSLGRAIAGKGRAGAKGKGLPKLPGGKAGGRRGIGTRLRGLLPKRGGKTGTGPKTGGKTGGRTPGRVRRLLGRFRKGGGLKPGGGKGSGTGRQRGRFRRLLGRIRNRKSAGQGTQKTRLVKPGEWVLLPAVPFIALIRWLRRRRKRQPPEENCRCPLTGREWCPVHGDHQDKPAAETAPPERHPGPALGPGSNGTTRRQPVTSAIEAVSEAIDTHIGGFEPENVNDLRAFLGDLPGRYEREASALTRLADRLSDELPIHQDIAEVFRELAGKAAGDGDFAAELVRVFESRHESDLERLDNPRPGEEFLDYGNQ